MQDVYQIVREPIELPSRPCGENTHHFGDDRSAFELTDESNDSLIHTGPAFATAELATACASGYAIQLFAECPKFLYIDTSRYPDILRREHQGDADGNQVSQDKNDSQESDEAARFGAELWRRG